MHKETVLVVDLGATNVQQVAGAVRQNGVYSEITSAKLTLAEAQKRDAKAIIITDLKTTPNATDFDSEAANKFADQLDSELLSSNIPVLVFGLARTIVANKLGGADLSDLDDTSSADVFGADNASNELNAAAIKTFLTKKVGVAATWNAKNIARDQVEKIRSQIGEGKVLCALSGGVDSAVAAALVHEAVGDQLVCVFVDHGLLREGEREQVEVDYVAATGIRLITVDAREQFLTALDGVSDPETKRKIIGHEFVRVFEQTQAELIEEAKGSGDPIKFLVQGTIYPDVVESGASDGKANIKSHHNVGGLPEDLTFELVEPLRDLFKDEVRAVGTELGLPDEIVQRQPFPGPGLGIRIVGAVNEERLNILRAADAIVRRELTAAGLDKEIWQCPVVLLADVRSVGVTNDERTYGHPIVLRPVWTQDAMTADWVRIPHEVLDHISNEITSAVPEVNRVVLDVTPKPPGTIEWE